MRHRTIRGHWDGTQVVLDEEIDLEPGTPVWVFFPSPEQVERYKDDPEALDAVMLAEIAEAEKTRYY